MCVPLRSSTLSSTVSSLSSTGLSLSCVEDKTEDNRQQQHKVTQQNIHVVFTNSDCRLFTDAVNIQDAQKTSDSQTPDVSPSGQSGSGNSSGGAVELFSPLVPLNNQ